MSDKIIEIERDINSLKLELEKERISRSGDRKVFLVITAALAVFFGYNTFWQVPRAITKAVSETAARTASDRIEALKKEAEETLLPEIRALKSAADSAKASAEQSAKSADESAKEAAEKWQLHASADLQKLKSLLPKPAKLSLSFKDLGKIETGAMKGWCRHSGAKTSWADVNGDGYADILCDDSEGRHYVQLSNGDGTFIDLGKVKEYWCYHKCSRTTWADVNGDNRADMICDDCDGGHWIQLSNSDD